MVVLADFAVIVAKACATILVYIKSVLLKLSKNVALRLSRLPQEQHMLRMTNLNCDMCLTIMRQVDTHESVKCGIVHTGM